MAQRLRSEGDARRPEGLSQDSHGDWRVLFSVEADVIVVRIAHRSTVYDD